MSSRDQFVKKIDLLISVYFSYRAEWQRTQTLAEFIADDLRDTLPDIMQQYLSEEEHV